MLASLSMIYTIYMKECKNLLHLLKYQVAGVFCMHFGMYKDTFLKIL